jgi:hypothetical protein
MAVFEYQKQVIFNMTVSPRCHLDTCIWYPNKNVVFGIPKAFFGIQTKTLILEYQKQVIFQYDAIEGGSRFLEYQ